MVGIKALCLCKIRTVPAATSCMRKDWYSWLAVAISRRLPPLRNQSHGLDRRTTIPRRTRGGLLRRFAPRNDGALRYDSAIPRHGLPEDFTNVRASETRGR